MCVLLYCTRDSIAVLIIYQNKQRTYVRMRFTVVSQLVDLILFGFDSTRFDLIHASFIPHHQIIINQPEKEKCILASTTFDAHEKLGHRCINDDPWKIYTVILGMLVYVDDNNITNNSRDGETVADDEL